MSMQEQPLTWGLVVEGDQVWSDKAKAWYEVHQAETMGTEQCVSLKGVPGAVIVPAGKAVRVRRGETGKAMDMFRVAFSGENKQMGQN